MENKRMGCVYMITSPVGKIYIGSSLNVESRWKKYKSLKCKDHPKLYKSLKKHSPEHQFDSLMEAEKITKVSNKCISNNIRSKTKTAGGYVWKVEE